MSRFAIISPGSWRLFALVTALPAVLTFLPVAAWAQSACSGVYSASKLQALPNPLTVQLEIWDNSARNIALAARFTAGMRNAGVQVSARPTAKLRLDVRLMGGSNETGSGVSQDPQYSDWGALQGDLDRTYPDMPEEQLLQRRRADGPTALSMRAELRANDDAPVAWVATVQCQIQTDSMADVATDMGALIGKSLGRMVNNQHF